VERGAYTFDNVACYRAEGRDHVLQCEPNDIMELWGVGWPVWVILDEDGNVINAFAGSVGTFDYIDSMIDSIVKS
jgi:hypothetical protein